jgi:hypothetical protein
MTVCLVSDWKQKKHWRVPLMICVFRVFHFLGLGYGTVETTGETKCFFDTRFLWVLYGDLCVYYESIKRKLKIRCIWVSVWWKTTGHEWGEKAKRNLFFLSKNYRGPRGRDLLFWDQFAPLFWTRKGIRKNCTFHWGVPPLRLRLVRENATASQQCVRVWLSKDNKKWECPHLARESLPLTSFFQCCGM